MDELGVIRFDLEHPYKSPELWNADAWVGYKRKIWKGRIDWKVQLNVRNLLGDTGLVAVLVQSYNGVPSAVRTPPEKRWYLTSTFEF
jgi:hypothetical protein